MTKESYKFPAREVIRRALMHAIDDREAMIEAQTNSLDGTYFDPEYVEICKKELHDFRLMLKHRYQWDY